MEIGDNLTQIILSIITLLGVIVSGFFTIMAAGRAGRAEANAGRAEFNSLANSTKLVDVEKKVDGISKERVDRETALGEAKAEVRFHEGGEAERKAGDERALAVLAAIPAVPPGPTEVAIVETAITLPVEIKDKLS